jgi:hypothetical protein
VRAAFIIRVIVYPALYPTAAFTSPPNEAVLRVFIALENSASSAGFSTLEPWVE